MIQRMQGTIWQYNKNKVLPTSLSDDVIYFIIVLVQDLNNCEKRRKMIIATNNEFFNLKLAVYSRNCKANSAPKRNK